MRKLRLESRPEYQSRCALVDAETGEIIQGINHINIDIAPDRPPVMTIFTHDFSAELNIDFVKVTYLVEPEQVERSWLETIREGFLRIFGRYVPGTDDTNWQDEESD